MNGFWLMVSAIACFSSEDGSVRRQAASTNNTQATQAEKRKILDEGVTGNNVDRNYCGDKG